MHFIKDKEQQEVDFIIANEGEPLVLIEDSNNINKGSLSAVRIDHVGVVCKKEIIQK